LYLTEPEHNEDDWTREGAKWPILPVQAHNHQATIRNLSQAIFTIPDLWHYCLGHPSTAPFQFLSKTISNFSFHPNMHYKICFMVKQTRLPFNLSSISSDAPFDLIHCDI
jgi:hypothetical protein